MRRNKSIWLTALLLPIFCSCSSGLKKIQKQRGFSNECFESIKLVSSRLEQSPDGITLKLNKKYLVNQEVWKKTIQDMMESFFHINMMECWSTNFTQDDIRKIFGRPTREVIGNLTQEISFEYVILNKTCTTENGRILRDFDCGLLIFTFNKEKFVRSGMLYLYE